MSKLQLDCYCVISTLNRASKSSHQQKHHWVVMSKQFYMIDP